MYPQYDYAEYCRYMTDIALAFVAMFEVRTTLGIIPDTRVCPDLHRTESRKPENGKDKIDCNGIVDAHESLRPWPKWSYNQV